MTFKQQVVAALGEVLEAEAQKKEKSDTLRHWFETDLAPRVAAAIETAMHAATMGENGDTGCRKALRELRRDPEDEVRRLRAEARECGGYIGEALDAIANSLEVAALVCCPACGTRVPKEKIAPRVPGNAVDGAA